MKKDTKHRDWQRVILVKLVDSMIRKAEPGVERKVNGVEQIWIDVLQVYRKLKRKMRERPEYARMRLLINMKDHLEEWVKRRSKHVITPQEWEEIIDKLHAEASGKVVDPFVPINTTECQEERERIWYEAIY